MMDDIEKFEIDFSITKISGKVIIIASREPLSTLCKVFALSLYMFTIHTHTRRKLRCRISIFWNTYQTWKSKVMKYRDATRIYNIYIEQIFIANHPRRRGCGGSRNKNPDGSRKLRHETQRVVKWPRKRRERSFPDPDFVAETRTREGKLRVEKYVMILTIYCWRNL